MFFVLRPSIMQARMEASARAWLSVSSCSPMPPDSVPAWARIPPADTQRTGALLCSVSGLPAHQGDQQPGGGFRAVHRHQLRHEGTLRYTAL